MTQTILLFIIGLASGAVSGMGIGGGTILIPALVLFAGANQHIAQSINLLYFIPTAIVALIIHIKNKRIDIKLALPIIIFGLVGAYFGSRLAIRLEGDILRRCFSIFLIIMGVHELFRKAGENNRNSYQK
jgi:uncharacterized membrane protein YfcA